jgi:hypothetical protein
MKKTTLNRLVIAAAALTLSSAAFAGDFICQKNSGCPINVDFPQVNAVNGQPIPPVVVKFNAIMSTQNGTELNTDDGWVSYPVSGPAYTPPGN